MLRGLIFDYGGTLDTGGDHWGRVLWRAYKYAGAPVRESLFRDAYVFAERELERNAIIKPDYTFRKTLEIKLRLQMEYIEERQPGFVATQWYNDVVDHLYANVTIEVERSRQVLNALRTLYPMVLVSNFYGNLNTVLKEFCLQPLFNAVIESASVGIRKPDPHLFALGVEPFGVPASDIVVVGDSYENDIKPAKIVGFQTIWLKGKEWKNVRRTDTSDADIIIEDIKEVSHAVETLDKRV